MMGSHRREFPVERMVHRPVHAVPPRTETVIDVDLEQPDEQPTLAPTVEELVYQADVDPPMEEPDSAMDEVDEPDEEEEGGLVEGDIQEDVDRMPEEARVDYKPANSPVPPVSSSKSKSEDEESAKAEAEEWGSNDARYKKKCRSTSPTEAVHWLRSGKGGNLKGIRESGIPGISQSAGNRESDLRLSFCKGMADYLLPTRMGIAKEFWGHIDAKVERRTRIGV
jgi:hypothetical protein